MIRRSCNTTLVIEPLKGTVGPTSLLVGVGPLPVLEIKGRLWQVVQRVLLFGLRRNVRLFLIIGLCLLFWFFLGLRLSRSLLLLLFRRRNKGHLLFCVLGFTIDRLQVRLVDYSLHVANEVSVFFAALGIHDHATSFLGDSSDRDIGESDTLCDEKGTGFQVFIHVIKRTLHLIVQSGFELGRDRLLIQVHQGYGRDLRLCYMDRHHCRYKTATQDRH